MEEKQIVDRLWDSYELSRTEAESIRQPVENLAKTSRQVAELRRSISTLGTPNLGAIEEYKRVSERYEFLSGQRDDVEKARRDLPDTPEEELKNIQTVADLAAYISRVTNLE